MSTITHRFKLTALSAAILAVNGIAHAQETDQSSIQEEELVVTGIRGALKRSIDDKRDAQNIVDTINAEDMGKTTDQNIADSLGRVTGVTVISRDGEGSTISIRGATAAQNNITLNGQTLTSTAFSQEVDLSSFSADILSKLEVVKTPSADHDEGSLGGSVNLVTTRALDRAEDVRSLTVQGRTNDLSEETNYKVSGAISGKFADDTLGVSVTAFSESNDYRRDEVFVDDFVAQNVIVATDENGNVVNNVQAIAPEKVNYELSQNSSDRAGGTIGIQWAPTDRFELTYDLTGSQQTQKQNSSSISARSGEIDDFVAGRRTQPGPLAPYSDPTHEWNHYNLGTSTFTKRIGRFRRGDFTNTVNGAENTNISSKIQADFDITDSLHVSGSIGYSNSKAEQLPNAYVNTQNFNNIRDRDLFDAGIDIEPVGFEQRGDDYYQVTGSTPLDPGPIIYDNPNTTPPIISNLDNTALSGFTPSDTFAQHLVAGGISENDRTVEDTILNAQVDFDFDLDTFGLTTIEFGAKYSEREKSVDDQSFDFQSLDKPVSIRDEFGRIISIPAAGDINSIRAENLNPSPIGSVGLLDSLGYGRSISTDGWDRIDARQAVELVANSDSAQRAIDPSNTRDTNIDTSALYLKTNFEFLDGRLTGDIGARYVRTEVESNSFAGISFWDFTEPFLRMVDFKTLAELRDDSLDPCPIYGGETDPYAFDYDLIFGAWAPDKLFNRPDGTGFDTNGNPDPSTWTRSNGDDATPCYMPEFVEAVAQANNNFITTNDTAEIDWENFWPYVDLSNAAWATWWNNPNFDDSTITYNGLPRENNAGGTWNIPQGWSWGSPAVGRDRIQVAVNNTHSYNNLLPSLNLNFAITDDLVTRFAMSRTMTRPEIDLLRAGPTMNEAQQWGGSLANGDMTVFNTNLDPLTSNNFDLSVEWYFSDAGVLSAALFLKDMENFTTTTANLEHVLDLRNSLDGFDPSPANLILSGTDEEILASCMPNRTLATVLAGEINGNQNGDSPFLSDDVSDICGTYLVNSVVNGADASIAGLELGYSQSYDFLPGYFLSGLGVSANYTYQDSEYDLLANETGPKFPVEETPEHTYNLTTYWEQDGHQVRLSYRGQTDSLVGIDYREGPDQRGRNWNEGSIWNEGRDTLDLSASYEVNDFATVTFQAINLTDAAYRQYFTSRTLEVDHIADYTDPSRGIEPGDIVRGPLQEGNPLEGDAPTSRTYRNYKVGTSYRVELRLTF